MLDVMWYFINGSLISAGYFLFTWNSYLTVMKVRSEYKEGEFDNSIWQVRAAVIIRVAIFAVENTLFNAIWGSIQFLELPQWHKKEFFFTDRVSRWSKKTGKRAEKARYYCKNWLNPFDIGNVHCDE